MCQAPVIVRIKRACSDGLFDDSSGLGEIVSALVNGCELARGKGIVRGQFERFLQRCNFARAIQST